MAHGNTLRRNTSARRIRHGGRASARGVASVPAGGSVAPGRGGDVVGLVLLPTPTTDVLAVVHGLVRATGLSVGAATDAIMEAEATGRAVVLRAHRELAELHAERCRAGGLRVLLERGSASAALGVER